MLRGYIKRDHKGKFKQVRKRAGLSPRLERRIQVVALGVLLGILAGISLDIATGDKQVIAEAKAEELVVVVEPQEVMIEIRYDWSQERIEQQIRSTFIEEPDKAVRVAKCEGIVNGKLDPKAFNHTNNSNDTGIFQISEKYHGQEVKRQGLDMENVIDNINYAHQLYKKNGWNDWVWSKHCWNK